LLSTKPQTRRCSSPPAVLRQVVPCLLGFCDVPKHRNGNSSAVIAGRRHLTADYMERMSRMLCRSESVPSEGLDVTGLFLGAPSVLMNSARACPTIWKKPLMSAAGLLERSGGMIEEACDCRMHAPRGKSPAILSYRRHVQMVIGYAALVRARLGLRSCRSLMVIFAQH